MPRRMRADARGDPPRRPSLPGGVGGSAGGPAGAVRGGRRGAPAAPAERAGGGDRGHPKATDYGMETARGPGARIGRERSDGARRAGGGHRGGRAHGRSRGGGANRDGDAGRRRHLLPGLAQSRCTSACERWAARYRRHPADRRAQRWSHIARMRIARADGADGDRGGGRGEPRRAGGGAHRAEAGQERGGSARPRELARLRRPPRAAGRGGATSCETPRTRSMPSTAWASERPRAARASWSPSCGRCWSRWAPDRTRSPSSPRPARHPRRRSSRWPSWSLSGTLVRGDGGRYLPRG